MEPRTERGRVGGGGGETWGCTVGYVSLYVVHT